ncbi:MAG: bifunctional folylpolyglutamate synthase/dihydrofolate synthase [Anaerolineales bacterium]|jgi:dihydrofolate synthase/folylpolyglutamate synthase
MADENHYTEALKFLFSFVDFSLTHQEQIAPERFELERMFDLMDKLGNPQLQYPTIHIAGTKGKGSVAAHCAAALQAAGYKTGLYTSPHLHDFRERIQIDGQRISKADFTAGIEVLKQVIPQVPGLTSYELQTALAFWYFGQKKVACAVVEVGMGGRLDSTNVLTPLVSVITNISYDHTSILGDTLAEIAGEKGGIIKPGVPVVSAPQKLEALEVLEQLASQREAEFVLVGRDIQFEPLTHSLEGQSFRVFQNGENGRTFTTQLLGRHQLENAVTAFAALQAVNRTGLSVSEQAVQKGFSSVRWPGRFEVFDGEPMVIFDGAHNRYSAQRLAQTIEDYLPGKPVALVFGASEDKDIAGMFAELLPKVDYVLLVRADHPRAAAVQDLSNLAADYACPVSVIDSPADFYRQASELIGNDGVILVTGSLYVVGQLRYLWLQK